MSSCLTVIYDRPADTAEFVRRYRNEHVPMANRILSPHGLRRWSIQHPHDVLDNAGHGVSLIVTLWFDATADVVLSALGSAEGQELYQHALSLTDAPMRSYLTDIEDIAA